MLPHLDAVIRDTHPSLLPCRGPEQRLWFTETADATRRAKELCQDCPVRTACLAGALERREVWGVWGGELFDNGEVIPAKRPRGRPRKNPLAA